MTNRSLRRAGPRKGWSSRAAAVLGLPPLSVQNGAGAVEVRITETTAPAAWFMDPFWIAAGVLGLLLVAILLVLASRAGNGGGGSTTIVK